MRLIYLLPILALCSCGPTQDTGRVDRVDNEIKDISFMGAHHEKRCSKGCRYIDVPDTWYIQFCQVDPPHECVTRSITHAPWSWQKVGQRVTLKWVQYSNWGSTWWRVREYTLTVTKEAVNL